MVGFFSFSLRTDVLDSVNWDFLSTDCTVECFLIDFLFLLLIVLGWCSTRLSLVIVIVFVKGPVFNSWFGYCGPNIMILSCTEFVNWIVVG